MSEWISVYTCLPEIGKKVLTVCKKSVNEKMYIDQSRRIENSHTGWWSDRFHEEVIVTHWHAL